MVGQLIQKRGFNFRKFSLYPDKICIESRSTRNTDRFEVKLEQLGLEKHYQAENTAAGKIMVVIFLLLPGIVWVNYFVRHDGTIQQATSITVMFGLLALFSILKQSKDNIFLVGGQKNIVFYRTVPDEKTTSAFIDLVIKTTKEHYLEKLSKYNDTIPQEMYQHQLFWLKDKGIINEVEYTQFIEEFRLKRLL